MRCVSKKFGVFEPDNFVSVDGMCFTEFLGPDGQVRLFPLDVITFNKSDQFVRGNIL